MVVKELCILNKIQKVIELTDVAMERNAIAQRGYLLQSSLFTNRERTRVTINDLSPAAKLLFLEVGREDLC